MKEYLPLIIAAFNGLLIPFCVWLVNENAKRKEEKNDLQRQLEKAISDFKLEYTKMETEMKAKIENVKEKNEDLRREQSIISDLLREVQSSFSDAKNKLDLLMLKLLKTRSA
jgi:phage-related tail protein